MRFAFVVTALLSLMLVAHAQDIRIEPMRPGGPIVTPVMPQTPNIPPRQQATPTIPSTTLPQAEQRATTGGAPRRDAACRIPRTEVLVHEAQPS